MNYMKSLRDTIYNKVWSRPTEKMGAFVKSKCDNIPQNKRLTVVTFLLTIFVLTAFFVFGNACYRIGRGQAMKGIQIEHLRSIDLPIQNDGVSPNNINIPINSADEVE